MTKSTNYLVENVRIQKRKELKLLRFSDQLNLVDQNSKLQRQKEVEVGGSTYRLEPLEAWRRHFEAHKPETAVGATSWRVGVSGSWTADA